MTNKAAKFIILCLTLCAAPYCLANDLSDVSNIGTGIMFMISNLLGACLVLVGIGFIIGSAVRLKYHFSNPMAMPLTNVIFMFLFGIISFLMVVMMHYREDHVFGERGGTLEGGTALRVKYYKNQKRTPEQAVAAVTPIQNFREKQDYVKNGGAVDDSDDDYYEEPDDEYAE